MTIRIKVNMPFEPASVIRLVGLTGIARVIGVQVSDVFEPPNLLSTATTHYLEIRVKKESKLLPQQQYEVIIDLDNSGEEQQSPVVYTGE